EALREKLSKPTDQAVKIEKVNGKVRLTRDQLVRLAKEDEDPAAKPNAGAGAKEEDDPLEAIEGRRIIEEQKTVGIVDANLARARRMLATDPDAAQDLIRGTLQMVRDHPDLTDKVRENLMGRLENTLRDLTLRGEQIKVARAAADRARAERLAREAELEQVREEQSNLIARM